MPLGGAVARLQGRVVRVAGRHVHLQHAGVRLYPQRRPQVAGHLKHRVVADQYVADEVVDAVVATGRGELFEQQGTDAATVCGVVDQ